MSEARQRLTAAARKHSAIYAEPQQADADLRIAMDESAKERKKERYREDGWPREWTWLYYHSGAGQGLSTTHPWMFFYKHRGRDETLIVYGQHEHFKAGMPETVWSVGELKALGLIDAMPDDFMDGVGAMSWGTLGSDETEVDK